MQIKLEGMDKVDKTLKGIENKLIHTAPLMAELANHLYNTVETSFQTQKTPDGISWNPIKKTTHKKIDGSQKILYASGHMQNSLYQDSNNKKASIGLNATKGGYPYPLIQQFGTKDNKIEARAFMPIKLDGSLYKNVENQLEEIIEDYMQL